MTVAESAISMITSMRHRDWGDGVVIGGDNDHVTVLFDEYGYRTVAMRAVEDNHLLEVQ